MLKLENDWKGSFDCANVQITEEPTKKPYFFADEIKINNQTVLTIPLENQFYEEDKPKRKSRWGDKAEKKSNLKKKKIFV